MHTCAYTHIDSVYLYAKLDYCKNREEYRYDP